MITPSGIEYLTDNNCLKKARDFLKDIQAIVPFIQPGQEAIMCHYTSDGQAFGISGRCDLNICYKDYPTIIKEAELNGHGKKRQNKKEMSPMKKQKN